MHQEKTWCIAKPSSSEAELAENINYVCDQLKDCSLIQANGACYNPNTSINHASVAMNMYYQSNGRNPWNCDFKNSGLISKTDPSKHTLIKQRILYNNSAKCLIYFFQKISFCAFLIHFAGYGGCKYLYYE